MTPGVPPPDSGTSTPAVPRDTPRSGPASAPATGAVDLDQLTTEELGAAFPAGDQTHLAEVYRRWSALVLTAADRALGSRSDAEDVTQQVFVSAWRSRSGYTPALGSLPAWLLGITRHRVVDRLRTRGREDALQDRLEQHPATSVGRPIGVATDVVDRVVLGQEIQQLPPPRGEILRMAFWEGFSYSQIAERLGLPLGTVKSHARRGLLHLRARLEEVAS